MKKLMVVPNIQSKEDVDFFIANLWEKRSACPDAVYERILEKLPPMTRLRNYFIRKNRELDDKIDKYNYDLRQSQLEEKERKAEEHRRAQEEKKRQIAEAKAKAAESAAEKKRIKQEAERKVNEIHEKIRLLEVEVNKRRKSGRSACAKLELGIFDNFRYIISLIGCWKLKLEIHNIKEQAQKELKRNFDVFSAGISADLYEQSIKDCFHHYYYQQFGQQFVSEHIPTVDDEMMQEQLRNLLDNIPDFELSWQDDLLELLTELCEEKRLSDFQSYFIRWHNEIIRYIDDHRSRMSYSQLMKDIALLVFCNMIWQSEDENVDYFITISQRISEKIGKNIRGVLYFALRELNYKDSHEFTTSLSDIIELEKNRKKEVLLHPQESGTILIPWSAVRFCNGYALLWHPSHINSPKHPPLMVTDVRIKAAFNNISQLFINRLQPIFVQSEAGVIKKVIKLPDFWEAIKLMHQPSLAPDFGLLIGKLTTVLPGLSKDQLGRIITTKDQKYLEFLCDKQLDSYKAYYLLELKVNSNEVPMEEEGFLFVVKESKSTVYLLYENSLPARASILFIVRKSEFEESVRFIHEYFASHTINKRELLSRHKVDASQHGILNYTHVNHTTFFEWKSNFNNFLSVERFYQLTIHRLSEKMRTFTHG